MSVRTGLYVRISDDPQGLRAGVRRQEEDCRVLCERRGWKVVGVYEDNDRSAYRGKPRPGYERLLGDMKAEAVEAVVVWHLDRLTRHPRELEEFFEIAEASGVELATATGDIDLGTSDGRFHARMLGAVARKESDDKSRRLRRKHEELALEGKVGGGGTRPFGFEADRRTVRSDEAELIREAAPRMLAGESMRSVLIDWAQRGVETPTGRSWGPTSFKRMLLSPRIAGLRELRGEVVGEAEWEPIIDAPTRERLVAVFERRSGGRSRAPRRYLLTGGLATCGWCDAGLVARPKGDGRRCYVCASGPGFSGCGRIRILAGSFERFLRDAVFEALDSPKLVDALRTQEDEGAEAELLGQIRSDDDALQQLARDHYAERLIGRSELLAARGALDARIEQAKSRLRRDTANRVLAELPAGRQALEEAWVEADVSWRRSLVAAVVERVVVGPAIRGRNFFDPDRIKLVWRA